MMKGKKKKLVVWLLALSLLVSSAPGLSVSAVGLATDTTENTTSEDDASGSTDVDQGTTDQAEDQGSGAADAVISDEPDDVPADDDQSLGTDGTEDSDGTNEQDETVEPDESTKQEETEESEEEKDEEDEEVQESLINYLIVGQAEMQAPGEQSVIVSYGDGTEEISSVRLVLTGEDGKQIEIPLTDKEEASYRFAKTFEESEAGTYYLTRFAYDQDGHKKYIELEKIGISAQFTVLAGAVQSESEECVEETGISVMTLTSDDISDEMTSDIEATIQEAADQAVEDVKEGAVELGASSTEQSYGRSGVSAAATAVVDDAVKLGAYSAPKAYTGTASSIVVVLDPGHGGTDNGASANGLVEKNINLKIAKYCKDELEKHNGVKVYMTRTEDKTVSLEARVEAAKLLGATLFVSIHMNSSTSNSAKGAEVYYPNPNYNSAVSNEGKAAAQSILNELVELGLANRGVKFLNATDNDDGQGVYADGSTADYYSVIRNSKKNGFPGIIVEHAFLSNKDDAAELKSETFLKQLGQADAEGILKYCQTKTDYSPVYDFSYYVGRYPDLKAIYGSNPVGALEHFINYGMSEGRQASSEFSVDAYMNRYPDLKSAFGTNYSAYYMHYINFGRKEGRVATVNGSNVNTNSGSNESPKANTPTNTIYGDVDYGAVYDYEYYINRYGDIAAAFSGDYAGALRHFVQNGMKEGRQAIGTFNVNSYKALNDKAPIKDKNGNETSLKGLNESPYNYGENLQLYYLHYIEHGKAEGRQAITGDESEGTNNNSNTGTSPTKYGLIDYAAVYDYDYYVSRYSDIKQAFGQNKEQVLLHFIRHGMDEGRTGKESFNVYGYKSRYSDLRAAFGDDLKKYYLHYIQYGQREGRTSELVKVTTYQGVDYSLVYDFDYYVKKYSDLEAVFSNDPASAIQHFIEHGIDEGRQAHPEFSISAYKNNYADLRNAFGDNDMAYVRHYIECGKGEERNAKSAVYHQITMSSDSPSTTTVKQMVMYFLANASYPTYYSKNTDVKTITDFCNLYITECNSVNIKPEVAFCQAMKETNFLQFGGDVKINQYNFAGLGATGNNESGASFRSIQEGIRAQVQHLKVYADKYATKNTLNNPCVDPRFEYVTPGSAPYVEWLGQKENPLPGNPGWATEAGYGTSIVNDYMNKLETFQK